MARWLRIKRSLWDQSFFYSWFFSASLYIFPHLSHIKSICSVLYARQAVFFQRFLCALRKKLKSSSDTPWFLPSHLCSPSLDGKRSHVSRWILQWHVHFQAPFMHRAFLMRCILSFVCFSSASRHPRQRIFELFCLCCYRCFFQNLKCPYLHPFSQL